MRNWEVVVLKNLLKNVKDKELSQEEKLILIEIQLDTILNNYNNYKEA